MATPKQNAEAIVAQAAVLDALIAQFREIRADIGARELELRKSLRGQFSGKAGQERLALWAHSLMVQPSNGASPSVAEMASSAWAEFL